MKYTETGGGLQGWSRGNEREKREDEDRLYRVGEREKRVRDAFSGIMKIMEGLEGSENCQPEIVNMIKKQLNDLQQEGHDSINLYPQNKAHESLKKSKKETNSLLTFRSNQLSETSQLNKENKNPARRDHSPFRFRTQRVLSELNEKLQKATTRCKTPSILESRSNQTMTDWDSHAPHMDRLALSQLPDNSFQSPRGQTSIYSGNPDTSKARSRNILNSPAGRITNKVRSPVQSPGRGAIRDAVDKMFAQVVSHRDYSKDHRRGNLTSDSDLSLFSLNKKPTKKQDLDSSSITSILKSPNSSTIKAGSFKSGQIHSPRRFASPSRTHISTTPKSKMIISKSKTKENEPTPIKIQLTRAVDGSVPYIEIESNQNHILQIRMAGLAPNTENRKFTSPPRRNVTPVKKRKEEGSIRIDMGSGLKHKLSQMISSGLLNQNSQKTIAIDLRDSRNTKFQRRESDEYGLLRIGSSQSKATICGGREKEVGGPEPEEGMCTPRQQYRIKDISKETLHQASSHYNTQSGRKGQSRGLVTAADRQSSQSKRCPRRRESLDEVQEIESAQREISNKLVYVENIVTEL